MAECGSMEPKLTLPPEIHLSLLFANNDLFTLQECIERDLCPAWWEILRDYTENILAMITEDYTQ